MILAIVGGRDFFDLGLMRKHIDPIIDQVEVIVSGGANGADKLAESYAALHSKPVYIFNADWDKYGKLAGFVRNKKIVEAAELVYAFWDGESHGTHHTIRIAEKMGVKCVVVPYGKFAEEGPLQIC